MKKIVFKTKWVFYSIFSILIELAVLGAGMSLSMYVDKGGSHFLSRIITDFMVYVVMGLPFIALYNYKKEIEIEHTKKEKIYRLKKLFWFRPDQEKNGISFEDAEKIILK